jgi:hypothetical protein
MHLKRVQNYYSRSMLGALVFLIGTKKFNPPSTKCAVKKNIKNVSEISGL